MIFSILLLSFLYVGHNLHQHIHQARVCVPQIQESIRYAHHCYATIYCKEGKHDLENVDTAIYSVQLKNVGW